MVTRRSSVRSKSAPGINRDYSDVEFRETNLYDGPEPTKGIYRLELVHVGDYTKTGDDEPSSVQWKFRAMDGETNKHGDSVAGWTDSKYTTENSAWSEQKIAVALGLIKPNGSLNMSYTDILKKAKPCRCLVVMERYVPEDGDPEFRAKLTSEFLPDDGGTKSRARSATDDDGDDEEPSKTVRRGRKAAEPEPEPEPEPADDDEADPEDNDELPTEEELEEYAEELEALSLAELKARAKEHGLTVKRGQKEDAIIEAILDDAAENGFPEDPEEPEPEPEPPARTRRGAAKTAAPARGRAKRGSSDDPPF